MSKINKFTLKNGVTLKIENNTRIWFDQNGEEISKKSLNDEEFNMIDCNLCHMLLTEYISKTSTPIYYERDEKNRIKITSKSKSKYSFIYQNVYVSKLDWDLARQIMMTPLPENSWWCQIYDSMDDASILFRPKSYYDIYKSYVDDWDYVYVCELGVPFYRRKVYGGFYAKEKMDKYYWMALNKNFFPDCDDIKDTKYVILTDCGKFRKCIGIGQMR